MATIEPADVVAAARACRDALAPAADRDWTVGAGDLEWDCRRTLDHVGDALAFYAAHLATRTTERLSSVRDGDQTVSVAQLLRSVESLAAVLARVAEASPPGTRAYHPAGMADAEGFLAMGCDEILVHTQDIALGLGVAWEPPADLCARVLARLFPWAPRDVEPWPALLWANGRAALPGLDRLGTDWYWHCAPLDEWDGTVKKREAPRAWT
jgi:hypothetical protein